MIINQNKKFIFVGLPFSACSAISKELLERYGCQTLLHKHASIPALLATRPDINVKKFEIIAVVRDPIETALTLYHWLKDNRYEHFTKPENFVENGGTVTRRYRKLYYKIQKNNMTFEQYLEYCFRFIPYDGLLSENAKFLTRIIRYEKLQDDFRICFSGLGLKIDRDLPSYNETENKSIDCNIDQQKLIRYFGPYLLHNAACYRDTSSNKNLDRNTVGLFNIFKFYVFRKLKSYYRLRTDLKLLSRNMSHID
jgi:hypothetical protein